jgi:hypothetical protein
MAEQLALDEIVRNRGAVEGDEGLAGPRAEGRDVLRDDLLPPKFCSFSRLQMPDAVRGITLCVRRLTTSRRLWIRNGLTRKSVAPAFIASMASDTAAWPEMMTKGTLGALPRTSKRRSMPERPGSMRSQKMTS